MTFIDSSHLTSFQSVHPPSSLRPATPSEHLSQPSQIHPSLFPVYPSEQTTKSGVSPARLALILPLLFSLLSDPSVGSSRSIARSCSRNMVLQLSPLRLPAWLSACAASTTHRPPLTSATSSSKGNLAIAVFPRELCVQLHPPRFCPNAHIFRHKGIFVKTEASAQLSGRYG